MKESREGPMGMQRAKTQTKGLHSTALERRCIEGAIVEESRGGRKRITFFLLPLPFSSVLLLALITLDLLNWNFDPIKLCLPLGAMASRPFLHDDSCNLSLSLSLSPNISSRSWAAFPTGAKLEGTRLASTPKSSRYRTALHPVFR